MKIIKLIIAFNFVMHICLAQKLRQATVVKVDATTLKVYGLKFQGNQIIYHISPSVNSRTIRIPRREISQIRYSNGKKEIIETRLLPVPDFLLRTSFNNGNGEIIFPAVGRKTSNGLRPDRIYLKDRRIIECKIIESSREEIKYVVVTDDARRVRTIKQKLVEKVEQNNVKANAPLASQVPKPIPDKTLYPGKNISRPPAVASKPVKKQEVQPKETAVAVIPRKTGETDFSNATLTLGIEASQILEIGSTQWTSEREGLGLKRAIGGSLAYSKRLNRSFGLAAEVGFTKWASEYRLKNETESLYTYSVGLSRLFVSAGPKVYFAKNFYVSPQAQINGLRLRQTGQEGESVTGPDRVQRTVYWGASGTVGYEFHIGNKFTADAGIRYHYLAKTFRMLDYAYPPNKPLHIVSFRVGFGLMSYRTSDK